MISESKVGSKGELFPSKEIRERLGLKPYTKIIYRVEDGKLIIEPVPDLEDLLNEPADVEITQNDLDEERRKLWREVET